jgi:hypothetical protein
MLLIGNLGNLDLGPETGGAKDLVLEMQGMLLPILGVLWAAIIIMVLLTTRKRTPRSTKVQGGGTPSLLLGLLLIASIVIVGAALSGGGTAPPGNGQDMGDTTQGSSGEISPGPTPGLTVFPIATLALAVAVVVAAVLLLRRGLRPTPTPMMDPTDIPTEPQDAVLAVGAAITELEAHPDPRSAILAAYARMAVRLGRPGEDKTLTPREFARKSGWRLRQSATSLEQLTSLFEEARYSDHPMGEEERERALASLRSIELELGGRTG